MLVVAEVIEAAAFSYFRVFFWFFVVVFRGWFFFFFGFFSFSCCCFGFVINTSTSVYECKTYSKTRRKEGRKKGNVLFNDALNTFYLYGYMASDIW